ncbi:GH3 auxin-responsive promoter [Suillus paluster]|uniref:GH3 auxin-responsive promoter n=1 Tax=Suillus paluster TaxID=48578 RepID=UPI001B861611|nr:GH3 auxin-responsive promoter [Suillus paluster]KAG1745976.1 GH3 auxin-responsive promoter [Suillus paluster]
MASFLYSPPLKSLTPELLTQLKERSEKFLFEIIGTNWKSQFCQTADELSIFRHAVETLHDDEEGFLQKFRKLVPLTVYDTYEPYVARFFNEPCQEAEVINLFAPGFPAFLAASSATSGKAPKFFAKYRGTTYRSLDTQGQRIHTYRLTCRVLNVFNGDQDIVRRITASAASGGLLRLKNGWNPEQDEDIMSSKGKFPTEAAPIAVAMVGYIPSFFLLHALFGLADRSVETLDLLFCTTLLDLFMYMDRDWFTLVDAIDNGTIPELKNIEHVRDQLQRHLHADPVRAAELRAIGPPSNTAGWAKSVWKNLRLARSVGSGPFSSAVPKVKHLLGPDVILQSPRFASSECFIGVKYHTGDLNRFRIVLDDGFIEYLELASEEVADNLCAAWEAEPGRHYELVLTTCHGLWRYRSGDIVELLGFAPDDGSPVVRFVERRKVEIRLDGIFVTEGQLAQSIYSVTQDTIGQVVEFTCFKDVRKLPHTIGFFVELAQEPGTASRHLAKQQLVDALSSVNEYVSGQYARGAMGMPTLRVVKPGTFTEYRKWRGEAAAIATLQLKVPVVMSDPIAQEWMINRVELEI